MSKMIKCPFTKIASILLAIVMIIGTIPTFCAINIELVATTQIENLPVIDKTDATSDETDFIAGDVNRDSKFDIRDATLVQKYLAKLSTLDEEQMIIADINTDNAVVIKDATVIQKKIAKLI